MATPATTEPERTSTLIECVDRTDKVVAAIIQTLQPIEMAMFGTASAMGNDYADCPDRKGLESRLQEIEQALHDVESTLVRFKERLGGDK